MSRVIVSDQGTQPDAPRRDVCIVTDANGKHRLCVDSTISVGSIEIGAVEIKDSNTGTTVDVETVYDFNAMMVYDAIEFQKVIINDYSESLISQGSTVTLNSYTVPTGKVFFLTGGIVGGSGPAIFEYIINGNTIIKVRNSGSDRTKRVIFDEKFEVSAGGVIEVKATNEYRLQRQYESLMMGYILNA